ncbi:MAG: MerR family transcriptional regulator [Methanotrichaceae archaeon]
MTLDQIPISRFSIITRISPKALRYYDQKGLLVPAAKDPFTGYRYYTADQLERGLRIKTLCNLGFTLERPSAALSVNFVESFSCPRTSAIW